MLSRDWKGNRRTFRQSVKISKNSLLRFRFVHISGFTSFIMFRCGQINDVSAGIIIQSLQEMPYLQNIGLNFMW